MPAARPPGRRCLGAQDKRCPKRALVQKGSRCQSCRIVHERARERRKSRDRKARGLRTGSTRAWRKLRLEVFKRDRWTCQLCGFVDRTRTGEGLHCDHVVPKVKGGTDDPGNLRTLCSRCNLKRGDRP